MKNVLLLLSCLVILISCDNNETPETETGMTFQFKFDSTQERLNGVGEPSTIPAENAAQSPIFNSMSGYFIELVPNKFTQIREGAIIYEAETQSSDNPDFGEAVIFDKAIVSDENIIFKTIPIKDIPIGTYNYLRISVTYQNMDVRFNMKNLPAPLPPNLDNQLGTFAGFIGFNTHLTDFTVKNKTLSINDDKTQGFWAFEPQLDEPYQGYYIQANPQGLSTGQSPAGSTTVVNPLAPFGVELPFGSCIVTGELDEPLTITGTETDDINITLSFSTNQSFEWVDDNGNGEWDFDIQAGTVEKVVDMGLRGLKVLVD